MPGARLLRSVLRRYAVVRREAIVERIEDALVASGVSIVTHANPRSAPFEITIRTPTGATLDLVCYAFTANGYRRAGRPDRHHFRITYGGGADRCHQLYFDPDGKRTTLLFGVHVEMDLFVGVDPMMHSPTRFPRSVELKKRDLETARTHRWHGWERERSNTGGSARPEESLLTETVIAFGPEQFLRYVEFERLASGLDCGERCLLSDRIEQNLSRGPLPTPPGRHALEIQLGLPASVILDVVMARIGRS
jgi:hypothetical protein